MSNIYYFPGCTRKPHWQKQFIELVKEFRMDRLGQRIVEDEATIRDKRMKALDLQKQAAALLREANEMERHLDNARRAG